MSRPVTRFRDTERDEVFWGDFDQRHTANLFGQYRWSPRSSLSGRFRFGSNYPLAGYYDSRNEPLVLGGEMFGYESIYTVAATRNSECLPAYARLDLRLDRTFSVAKGRLMLFAEVTNVFARDNQRQEFHGYWRRPDGTVKFNSPLASMFPFMPSVGVLIEF
jgi:hypothetical protein